MKTYFIKTFGCQMNISDSERIAGFLESLGLKPLIENIKADLSAEALAKADLVIFNTCGVRQAAENRVYTLIHNLKKKYPDKKVVLTGCLASRKDVQKRLKNLVDLFFPINDIGSFKNWIIKNYFKIKNLKFKISAQNNQLNRENIAYLSINPKHDNNYQAYVPIMTGCNNFCSYCVVPYARGREISRPVEEITNEIKALIKNGCKHIMLLGQNVNSYKSPITLSSSPSGRGCRVLATDEGTNFSKLLKKINAIPGIFWISFVSSHPKDFDDELIQTIARCKKVCEWVHLPIQAGDDEIIRRMNRHYTRKQYLEKIKKVKKAFKTYKPDMLYSISSDIIVGFPGETKKQFLQSADIMKKAKYDMVFFGQFSPRPGTVAWKMKDSVSKKEKARREKYLNEILKRTSFANNKKYVGKILEVLIEKQDKDCYFGKTRTMKNVRIHSLLTPTLSSGRRGGNIVGKIVKVKIIKANVWNLEACLPARQEEIK